MAQRLVEETLPTGMYMAHGHCCHSMEPYFANLPNVVLDNISQRSDLTNGSIPHYSRLLDRLTTYRK